MPDEPEDTDDESMEAIQRELERRLHEIDLPEEERVDKNRFPPPPDEDEIELRLADMRSKVASAGATRMPEPPDFEFQRPKSGRPDGNDKQGYRGLGIGLTAAYALVGMMALGFGIGWLFDHGANGANFGPAIGGLVGCIAGIVFVIWLINRES
jgi:hypothetical protein